MEESLKIRVSPDEMEAYIQVLLPEEGKPPTLKQAKDALQESRVAFGVDDKLLSKVFREKRFDEEIKIAQGKGPIAGEDARIEYLFETERELKPKERKDGTADYKDLSLIQSVSQGQKLAKKIPPKPGVPGMTVMGQEIPLSEGKDVKLSMGKNTEVSPDDGSLLIASVDGNVSLSPLGKVEVSPVYVVKGDVDYSTGNIKHSGSLEIRGDVKSGFEVKADKNLEVWGCIEDAYAEAGEDVLVKKGLLGHGKGKLVAGGDVHIKHIENQHLRSNGNITVGEEILNSIVESQGGIVVNGQKGAIVGGRVSAGQKIEARTIGNPEGVLTEIFLGEVSWLGEEMEKIEGQISNIGVNIDKVTQALYALFKMEGQGGNLPPEKAGLLKRLKQTQAALGGQIRDLKREKQEISEKMKEAEKGAKIAQLKVLGTVYPGMKLTLHGLKKEITEEMKGITFRIEANQIVTSSCY